MHSLKKPIVKTRRICFLTAIHMFNERQNRTWRLHLYAIDLRKWILYSFGEKCKKKFQTENAQILSMHYAQSTLNFIADCQHNNLKFLNRFKRP